jgi:MFS family permease
LPTTPRLRPYHALRHRDFRLLGTATLVSIVGTQMQNVGIDWHVYVLTHSPLALGTVGLVRVIPLVLFSVWGGVVADRFDRKKVQFTTQGLLALTALLLAGATWLGRDTVWLIYGVAALAAATSAFDAPARTALVPRLVPKENLPGALSINLTFFHVGMIVGPSLAGMIIALTGAGSGMTQTAHAAAAQAQGAVSTLATTSPHNTQGLTWIYAANALSFMIVQVALLFVRASGKPEPAAHGEEHVIASLKSGFRFLMSTPIIVWTMSLDFFATLFSGAISLLPIVADQILHVGPTGYGWLRSATGAGALAASIVTAVHHLPRRQGPWLLWSVAAYGAFTVLYGFSRNFYLTFFALAASGASDMISTVVRHILRQVLTPDEMRGRVTGFNMIFFIGGPQLGEMEAGFVASLFRTAALGTVISIASGGIATLILTAVVAAGAPVVRNYVLPEGVAELPAGAS